MWAIVGLGNPGRYYSKTRHNVGFLFIKKLAKEWNVKVKKKKFSSKVTEVSKNREKILLAMPQTYMNNSGFAVRQIIDGKKIKPEHVVVIYDDLDLSMGEIRIREKGGGGTHKGMSSIIQEVQTTEIPRIRVGIGPLSPHEDATEYVLSSFEEEEQPLLEESIKKARTALEIILSGEVERAMNEFNQRGKTFSG